jgi:TatD DNase family protein
VIVDSHCHLDDAAFEGDRDEVLERAREAGVGMVLAIGTGDGPPDLEAAIRLAERYDAVYATVGIHPHDAAKADVASLDRLAELCGHPKVVAVGEIGLDYHYDNSPRERQREVFVDQMQIARQAGKPVVIHTRDAWEDTMELLSTHWRPSGLSGIMHCFSGDTGRARESIELGFLISFAGVVTFRRAEPLREAAAAVPQDCLLVETDAPYLTPEPHRKIRRNEPRYVVETARRLAEVRGVPYEELAAETSRNFCRLFDLPVPG